MAYFLRKLNELPKRLVISRTDRIGDVMQTLPVFERIKAELPIELFLLCDDLTAPLAKHNPYIDGIIAINARVKPQKAAALIQAHQVDGLLVMVADPTIRAILPHLKDLPLRMGPLTKPGLLFSYSHPVVQKRSKSLHNEAWYNLELLEAFGIQGGREVRPKIYFDVGELDRFREKLKEIAPELKRQDHYLVFHAGMKGSALNWPKEFYKDLLFRLLGQGYQVILTGQSEEEVELNRYLKEGLTGRLFDLTGQLNLRQLACLLKSAKLFIGPSTGPTHIANGAGTPLISFYPPIQVQSKTRWEPYLAESTIFVPAVDCPAKYSCQGGSCKAYPCMNWIQPEEVFAAAQRYMDAT